MENEEKTFTMKKSVDWLDPRQLVKSGIKALISTTSCLKIIVRSKNKFISKNVP